MKRNALCLAVCLAVGSVLLAGCGDEGQETLSKAEYLEQAKEICREGNQELAEASRKAFQDVQQGEAPSEEQLENYARDVVVPMVRDQVKQLRALPAPEGGAGEVDEIYDAFERALDRIDENPSLLTDNPDVFDLFKEADELSKKYGYAVCT